jgi:hypothetical protein
MAAILVYSSKWCKITTVKVYSDDTNWLSVNKLVDAIFKKRTTRLTLTENRYFYNPTDEYKKFVVRFKKIR